MRTVEASVNWIAIASMAPVTMAPVTMAPVTIASVSTVPTVSIAQAIAPVTVFTLDFGRHSPSHKQSNENECQLLKIRNSINIRLNLITQMNTQLFLKTIYLKV
jgi:hypothetical protein